MKLYNLLCWPTCNVSFHTAAGTVVRRREITVEANGMLFSTNQSSNVSVLTTVNGFGLSSLAVAGYSCFANNSFNTTRTNITLNITGWYCIYRCMAIYSIAELNTRLFNYIADLHPLSFTFLRFSTTPLDELQQMLGLPSLQLLFAFIHTAVCYIHHYQWVLNCPWKNVLLSSFWGFLMKIYQLINKHKLSSAGM